MIGLLLQPVVTRVWRTSIDQCMNRAMRILAPLIGTLGNVGGGIGSGVDSSRSDRWPWALNCDGRLNGIDFNTSRLPFEDASLDAVVCEQVIEHLHNTTWFVSELNRVLKPNGTLVLSTENLASWPNLLALLSGCAPFSTQPCCGRYRGGWKVEELPHTWNVADNHPCYSGMSGHVRVLTARQLIGMLREGGFTIQKVYYFGFKHFILIHANKTPL